MEAILSALAEEEEQARRLLKRYKEELQRLPQGTFFLRRLGRNLYAYLTYSENQKIKQKYLGRLSDEETRRYQDLIARKKKLKELIGKTKTQHRFLERTIKRAGKKS